MTAQQWIESFAAELGVAAPTADEFDALLGLAANAAHASERTAAPVACWLAAKAGITPTDARDRSASIG